MKSFSEFDLVTLIAPFLAKHFNTNMFFREFSAGYGIADLTYAKNYYFNETGNFKPISDYCAFRIFLKIKEKGVLNTNDLIKELIFFSKHKIMEQLSLLIKKNYIKKEGTLLSIELDNLNPIENLIAIEAKLEDYKGGFIQAKRYKFFANETYLAILKKVESKIDLDTLAKEGVGLILYDDIKNIISIPLPAKTFAPNFILKKEMNEYAKELIIQEYLNSMKTFLQVSSTPSDNLG